MKIIFLGTSSGTPTKSRNVSGCAIVEEQSKDWYLVDCGEGTQQRILHAAVSLLSLKAIFITHIHGDHCYGLPGLLASAGMLGRTAPLTIVAPEGVQAFFQSVMLNTDLHIGYEIQFVLPENGQPAFEGNKAVVSAVSLSHRVECFAYQFTESKVEQCLNSEKLMALGVEKGPVWGRLKILANSTQLLANEFLLSPRKPRSVMVCGDNDDPKLLESACKDVDVLVHEATYTEQILLQVGPTVQHCSAETIAKFAEEVKVKNLVLTHFSPRFSDNPEAKFNIGMIRKEAKSHYSGNLVMAEDLNVYELTRNGDFFKIK